jgi:hypothetical protein
MGWVDQEHILYVAGSLDGTEGVIGCLSRKSFFPRCIEYVQNRFAVSDS